MNPSDPIACLRQAFKQGALPFGAALYLLFAALLSSSAQAGDSLVGQVTAVRAANVITLDYGAGEYEIRISGIELSDDDAINAQATEAMSDLLLGKTVRLRFAGRSPDGTMYGKIWVSGIGEDEKPVRDAGVELVRRGLARGRDDDYRYREMSQAELEAREARRGLWQ